MLELTECPDSTCRALAEVIDYFILPSTHGPVEHVRTRCINRHHFTVPTPARLFAVHDRSIVEQPRHADPERTH
jgi:hypothetical protein